MKVKVKAKIVFNDVEGKIRRTVNDEWVCSKERGVYLQDNNAVEIIEEIKEAEDDFNKLAEDIKKTGLKTEDIQITPKEKKKTTTKKSTGKKK